MTVHIADERWLPDRWITYCDANDAKAHMQEDPAHATCAACIEAYETRPQPVTTRDLAGVLRLVTWLVREGSPKARVAISALEAKLNRPRQAKPGPHVTSRSPVARAAALAVMMPTALLSGMRRCGKCQAPVDDDNDCPRCYPR